MYLVSSVQDSTSEETDEDQDQDAVMQSPRAQKGILNCFLKNTFNFIY